MKKGMMILGLAAAVTAAQTMPAQAINKEWSAVAGFVGGILVANAHNNHHQYRHQRVQKQSYLEHDRYRQPSQRVSHKSSAHRTVVYEEPVRSGYYTWETRRVYVPGRWVYEDTGCGTQRKVWYAGHYQTQRYKVWVDTSCRTGW